MPRLILGLVLTFAFAGSAYGDWIVSEGEIHYLYLQGGAGPELQVTLGYGESSNTIGDKVWFSTIGTYDVSVDPDFSSFLIPATNGIRDTLYVTFSDQYGHSLPLYFDSTYSELHWLGHYPDLAPWEISGARVSVNSIMPSAQGVDVSVHWQFLGVPEPGSVILLAAGALLARHPRRHADRDIKQGYQVAVAKCSG